MRFNRNTPGFQSRPHPHPGQGKINMQYTTRPGTQGSMNKASVYGSQLAYSSNSNMGNPISPVSLYSSATNEQNMLSNSYCTNRTGSHPNVLPTQRPHQSQLGWSSYGQTPAMQKVNQSYQGQRSSTPLQQNSYSTSGSQNTTSPATNKQSQQQMGMGSTYYPSQLAQMQQQHQMHTSSYQSQNRNVGPVQSMNGMMSQNPKFQQSQSTTMPTMTCYTPSLRSQQQQQQQQKFQTQSSISWSPSNSLSQNSVAAHHASGFLQDSNGNVEGHKQTPNGETYTTTSSLNRLQPQSMSVGNYQALNSVRNQQNMFQNQNPALQMQMQQQMSPAYQLQNKSLYGPCQPSSMQSNYSSASQLNNSTNSSSKLMYGHGHNTIMNSGSQVYGAQYRPSGSQTENYSQQQQQQMTVPANGGQVTSSNQMRQMNYSGNGEQMTNPRPILTPAQMRASQLSGQFMTSEGRLTNSELMSQANQNMSQTFSNPHTIRVGVPGPEGVLEPQTIRVTGAMQPTPTQQESPVIKVGLGLPQGGSQNYGSSGNNQAMTLVESSQGDVEQVDSGASQGIKYIPMSWGELLGGEKDGLNGLKVIMAAPPDTEATNQNRQLRVAFGNQPVVTQPGEVPLKVISINPVEGYQMRPVSVADVNFPSDATQSYPHQNHSIQASPNGTQSLTNPTIRPSLNAVPLRMPSSSMYTSCLSKNISVARRSDFAGTKYY